MNNEKRQIEKGKKRKAIKGEIEAFNQYIRKHCNEFRSDIANISDVKEPRINKDIAITLIIGAYILLCLYAILYSTEINLEIPLIMKIVLGISSVEMFFMLGHLHATNFLYRKKIESKLLVHRIKEKKEFYSNIITEIALCISFTPMFILNFILRILGLDTIKKYYGTYVVAITLPIIPSCLLSFWILGLLDNTENIDLSSPMLLVSFVLMLVIDMVMIYFIARFSFYIVNYNDYLNDRKLRDNEFIRFWTQMKIVIYLLYFIISFISKIMDKSVILTSFVAALSLVMIANNIRL